MYCIYVSNNGKDIQKVLNNKNEVIRTDNIEMLMQFAKQLKNVYCTLNISIIEEETGAIIVDYQ